MKTLFDTAQAKPAVPVEFLDDSLLNKYGEECVSVIVKPRREGEVLRYRCLEDKWKAAFAAWEAALKTDRCAPQPMPSGHCMFVTPEDYGSRAW